MSKTGVISASLRTELHSAQAANSQPKPNYAFVDVHDFVFGVNRLRILTPDRRPKLTPYDPVLFTALGSVSRAASLGLFLCSTERLFLRPDRLHFARRAQALSRMTRSVTGESRRGASWTVASTARC
jgi:hypothetical protein